jgi:hypothetical protein
VNAVRVCPFCEKLPDDDDTMYLVNSPGGYGMPEMWACSDCMRRAEPGSKLAKLRDGIYADDFRQPQPPGSAP